MAKRVIRINRWPNDILDVTQKELLDFIGYELQKQMRLWPVDTGRSKRGLKFYKDKNSVAVLSRVEGYPFIIGKRLMNDPVKKRLSQAGFGQGKSNRFSKSQRIVKRAAKGWRQRPANKRRPKKGWPQHIVA